MEMKVVHTSERWSRTLLWAAAVSFSATATTSAASTLTITQTDSSTAESTADVWGSQLYIHRSAV